MNPAEIASIASASESFGTLIALAVGAWWTFILFVQRRERFPRAKTVHNVTLVGSVGGKKLLRVSVELENKGGVLLELAEGQMVLQEVWPPPRAWVSAIQAGEKLGRTPSNEFCWPVAEDITINLGEYTCRVEPGESQDFHFDAMVSDSVQTLQVYTFFRNETVRDRELGWVFTTLHKLHGDKNGNQAAGLDRDKATAP